MQNKSERAKISFKWAQQIDEKSISQNFIKSNK